MMMIVDKSEVVDEVVVGLDAKLYESARLGEEFRITVPIGGRCSKSVLFRELEDGRPSGRWMVFAGRSIDIMIDRGLAKTRGRPIASCNSPNQSAWKFGVE